MQKTIQRCYAFSTKIVVAAMLALTAATVHAQYTGSYQTITIKDGVISNHPGPYYVGGTVADRWGNVLIVTNAGQLFITNSVWGQGFLGGHATSSNNTAVVTGSGSIWSNSGSLYVGTAGGANNQLTIADGGTVYNAAGTVGYSGANNMALITGTGSVWNATALTVGNVGVGSRLTISNGGAVVNTGAGTIGNAASASNSMVLVTGSGSVWRSTGIDFGGGTDGSADSKLTIADGGAVYNSGNIRLGAHGNTMRNTVLITGAGSVLSNGNFTVSFRSTVGGNQLIVADGGTAYNAAIIVGSQGTGNQLTITNGGTVYATSTSLADTTATSNNTVLVAGAGSVLTNSGILYVGSVGVGNQMTIADGGTVYNAAGYIGFTGAAVKSNTVFVSGRGSVWRTTGNLLVNNAGTGNGLIMSNGGVASVSGSVVINPTGYITNYVTGIAGGLDMAAGKTLTPTNMGIFFVAEPTETGPFWGLRWQGTNAVATLRGYTNSGALRIDFTALPEYWRKKASDPIFYDGANTYIGFNVTHIPVKGTIVSVW